MIFCITITISAAHCGLLRTPRVYNALITTDQNLKPSQAFPVIQPHIQESPYIPYSFNTYSPFNVFDPYSQLSNLLNSRAYQSRKAISANDIGVSIDKNALDNAFARGNVPSFAIGATDGAAANRPANGDAPIPVNEFGLPPSLVPLAGGSGWNQGPINLSPYHFNSYPLIYDQFNGGLPGNYLPHFGYYPPFYPRRNPIGAAGVDGAAPGGVGGANAGSADGASSTGGATAAADGTDNGGIVSSNDAGNAGGGSVSSGGSEASSTSGSAASGGAGSSSGGGTSSGGSGTSFSTSSSSRGGRAFIITDEGIKNYPNRNRDIQDVPPPPLPFGASRSRQ